ncbi:MAG: putative acetyltransferase EpsM [Pseudomonas citronellolis]|nr:MAG: putative acetyltransferase EpsM [Pseudomonas citronellolis]
MTKQVVILGGHGDGLVAAQVILDMARAGQDIVLAGFLNDHNPPGSDIGGYPVLGRTGDWHELPAATVFHFALLSVGKMQQRADLIRSFGIPPERVVSLIHPSTQLASDCIVGAGALICAYAVLQPGVRTGVCCSIRAGANLGHDVRLDDFVYVGPNATLCGYASVDCGAYVAPNAVVRDRTEVGAFAVLAAGSVAYKSLPPGSTWIGNPARRSV